MIALSSAISLTLALILGPSTWQEPTEEAPAPEDFQPKLVEIDGEVAQIPFTLGKRRPIPVIEAMVNGKGPFKFYYDTGASVCVLHSGFVEEMGIASLGKTEVGDHTANARIPADRVELATVELNGIRFENVPALAFDRSRLGGDEIRGVLGLPLFHEHLLTIDYHKQQMEISRASLAEEGLGILPYGGEMLPEMMITVNGEEISCHIDSGSPTGLMLPTSFVDQLPHKNEPQKIGEARTVNSVLEIWSVQLDATANIAGNKLLDPSVVYNEMVPNALIGYQILKDMVLSIDQRSKRVRLLPNTLHANLAGIERAALDYAESYYELKPEYVDRSIHRDLAKIGYTWRDGKWKTHPMDYDGFMNMVMWYVNNDHTPDPGPKEVVVLAATAKTALVKLTGSWGIDYMHIAQYDGGWQTRNVVWQSVPEPRPAEAIDKDRAVVEQVALDYYDQLSKGSDGVAHPGGDVEILGVMDRVACARLTTEKGVDFMNFIQDDEGRWQVQHVMSHP